MTSTAAIRDKATTGRPQRIGDRRRVSVPGRLTWRDSSGTLRFVSVTTRDVSDVDAFVECDRPASIPLYRLVHFQVETSARGVDIPEALQRGKVLSAVYRVGPYQSSTGTPQGYALRLMVEPKRAGTTAEQRKKLSDLWAALNADPEMKELAAKAGFELVNVGVDGMDAYMKARSRVYVDVGKKMGLGGK